MKIRSIHPAWWMLACSCALIFVGQGMVSSCVGIFFQPASEELGVGIGTLSGYVTLQGIANAVVTPFAGRMLPQCRIRVVASAAAIATCAAFGAMAFYNHVALWYISGAIIGIAQPFCGLLIATVVVNNWFKKKVGLATGIVMAFSGVGGVVLSPIISTIISSAGWRTGYLAAGVIGAATVLPFTLLVLRCKPSDLGVRAYGEEAPETETPRVTETMEDSGDVMVSNVLRSPRFYVLFIAVILMSAFNAVVQHVSGYGTDNGLPYTTAGMVLSVLMFTMMVGKVLIGTIIDRYGLTRTVAGASAVCLMGLAILIAGSTFPVLSIGAGVLGLSAALVTVIPAMATRQIFGSENYTQTYSFITIASILGANGSVPLLGFLYDYTKSYRVGFVVVACLITVSAVMYLATLRSTRRNGPGFIGAKLQEPD